MQHASNLTGRTLLNAGPSTKIELQTLSNTSKIPLFEPVWPEMCRTYLSSNPEKPNIEPSLLDQNGTMNPPEASKDLEPLNHKLSLTNVILSFIYLIDRNQILEF